MTILDYHKKRKKRRQLFTPVDMDLRHRRRFRTSRRYQKKRKKGVGKALSITVLVVALLLGAGTGAFYWLKNSGKQGLMEAANTAQPDLGEEKGQDVSGLVSRNGKKYTYNQDAVNILCLGIDKRTELTEGAGAVGQNGQADTILLVSIDPAENTLKIVAISRDTMTEIRTYDHQGKYIGKSTNHLAVAYSLGDGGTGSCELVADAVSGLLYDLPIHGYAAVNISAIQKLNDAVGGVTVTLDEDMKLDGEEFPAGTTLTLVGSQAESFVRTRDMEQAGSNNYRMQRQKQYAVSFLSAAAKTIKQNPAVVTELYSALSEDMVTSIGLEEAVYLASLIPGIQFSADDIQALAGTTKKGAVYEEFYPDEEALLETVLEVFYTEVEQPSGTGQITETGPPPEARTITETEKPPETTLLSELESLPEAK